MLQNEETWNYMCVTPVGHNVRFESHECTTSGTRRAERVKKKSSMDIVWGYQL